MRLVDMERQLKATIEEKGIEDQSVFHEIYDLCFEYLKRGRKMNTIAEEEETAMILAETLYLKVCKGGYIHSWLGYISIAAMAAIRTYRKMNASEIWETSEDTKLEETIINISSAGSISLNSSNYSHVYNKECIDKIYLCIENILDNSCRYYRDTSDWNNLYLFILVSLSSRYPVDVCIKPSERQYYYMMLSLVRDKLIKEFKVSCDDTKISGRDLVYLFTMGEISGD